MVLLRKGSRGSAVTALQEMLNELGYNCGLADGIFGIKTENAVKSFQMEHGLTADGIVGEATMTALAAADDIVPEVPADGQEMSHEAPEQSQTITLTIEQYKALQTAYNALKSILGA